MGVPDECVPKELLHALSPHPTSIIGACDDARRFCVIAAPREAEISSASIKLRRPRKSKKMMIPSWKMQTLTSRKKMVKKM